MSQTDDSQEFLDEGQLPLATSWSTPPASSTNRPADGAARVDSMQQVEQKWSAGEGATDFLGLEQESGAEAPAALTSSEPVANGAPSPTQNWLFQMENQVAAPPAAESGIENADGEADPAPEQDEQEEATYKRATGSTQTQIPTRRRGAWLAAAGVLLCAGAVAGWRYWDAHRGVPATNHTTAVVPPKPGTKHTPDVVAQTPPKPATNKLPTPTPTPSEPVVASTPTEPTPAEPAPTSTPVETAPVVSETPTPVSDPLAINEPSEPNTSTPALFTGPQPILPPSTAALPKGARHATTEDLAHLWMQAEIPFDAITGDSEIRTPKVGAVRVLLKNGEHLQGRLHSVGLGRLSVDVELGRMAVDYSDVRELVQIMEKELARTPGNGLPAETAGLPYVSARVPSGTISGWLVSRHEGRLTLITESARRLTIDDAGYEPVSKGKARIVGTLTPRH